MVVGGDGDDVEGEHRHRRVEEEPVAAAYDVRGRIVQRHDQKQDRADHKGGDSVGDVIRESHIPHNKGELRFAKE